MCFGSAMQEKVVLAFLFIILVVTIFKISEFPIENVIKIPGEYYLNNSSSQITTLNRPIGKEIRQKLKLISGPQIKTVFIWEESIL